MAPSATKLWLASDGHRFCRELLSRSNASHLLVTGLAFLWEWSRRIALPDFAIALTSQRDLAALQRRPPAFAQFRPTRGYPTSCHLAWRAVVGQALRLPERERASDAFVLQPRR